MSRTDWLIPRRNRTTFVQFMQQREIVEPIAEPARCCRFCDESLDTEAEFCWACNMPQTQAAGLFGGELGHGWATGTLSATTNE